MVSRRNFLKFTAVGGAALLAGSLPGKLRFPFSAVYPAQAAVSPQIPLAAGAIPQFTDPLPGLDVIAAQPDDPIQGPVQIELRMTEFQTQVLPASMGLKTWVWGYLQPGQTGRDSYLGPVIIATRNQPAEFKFVNNLNTADTTNVLAYKYGTDQTLHWADPAHNSENMWNHMAMPPAPGSEGAQNYTGSIPACVHLHGGEVPPQLDGGPDAWFTSDGLKKGSGFYSKDGSAATNYSILRYPNTQEGGLIWFHDHTLGATRLNVYCGLAGGYLLVDPANDPVNLPPLLPLIVQDRMFDVNGQLFFPAASNAGVQWAPNPEHPYWVPEFLGDVICVNGKAWPYANVEAKRYTCLFLNGSNARSYEMSLVDPVSGNPGPTLWVIGSDGAFLDTPAQVSPTAAANNKLVMMPGERYYVIIDFAGFQAGVVGPNGAAYSGSWLLKNTAKAPYPAGATVQGVTTGRIMLFKVLPASSPDTSLDPAQPGIRIRPAASPSVRLVDAARGSLLPGIAVQQNRQVTLNEIMGMPQTVVDPVTGNLTAFPGGPLEILVNNTRWDGKRIKGTKIDPATGMVMSDFETRADFSLDSFGINWLSERPNEGETEVWEIINLTADAHPMHTHLVQFQLINRQSIDIKKYNASYAAAFPGGGYDPMTQSPYGKGVFIPGFGPPLDYATGNPAALGGNPDINALSAKGRSLYLKGLTIPPLPQEAGWKDVILVPPGMVTRLAVRWAPTSTPAGTPPAASGFPFNPGGGPGYVWHCHIVDHEDNEMMRPDEVTPIAGAQRSIVLGRDY